MRRPTGDGIPARFADECNLCGQPIVRGEEVIPRRGGWVHAACAPGQDES